MFPLVYLIFSKRSLVFPILLFSSISLHWSLRKAYLSLLFFGTLHSNGYIFPFLLCLLLLFFPQLFVRPLQTTILPFCNSFSWGWSWSLPSVQCHIPSSIVRQALCLSDLIPWIYLSLPVYNWKDSDLDHIWGSSGFPYFLQFKSEFCNKEFMIQATVSSPSCFCWVLICRVHHAKYHAVWSTNWNQDCQEKYQ